MNKILAMKNKTAEQALRRNSARQFILKTFK